jgi:cellulose biosynthesis protein BcsQ
MTTPSPAPTIFATFYSFKGGVGRSMALLHTAQVIASLGRNVLIMDMDLEAPGITYMLPDDKGKPESTLGFVNIIYDLLSQGRTAPYNHQDHAEAVRYYSRELRLPESLAEEGAGRLWLMPAGRMDADYERLLNKIDLRGLYAEGKGRPILAHIRNVIERAKINDQPLFDYVLIDSRTGFSDAATICVRDLADYLVVVMGLNRQNVEGTTRFLERLKEGGIDPKGLFLVASPMPIGEDDLRRSRMQMARKVLSDAWGKTVELDLSITYHPRLALDEDPASYDWTDTDLWPKYQRLAHRVMSWAGDGFQNWALKYLDAIANQDLEQAESAKTFLQKIDPKTFSLIERWIDLLIPGKKAKKKLLIGSNIYSKLHA